MDAIFDKKAQGTHFLLLLLLVVCRAVVQLLTVYRSAEENLGLSLSLSLSAAANPPTKHMGDRSNGEVLMLEAPPCYGGSSSSNAEIIDALPYIDDDYGDPRVKLEVDRLVEDEMRRSSKKPTDFLKDFPPLPNSNFQASLSPPTPTLGF